MKIAKSDKASGQPAGIAYIQQGVTGKRMPAVPVLQKKEDLVADEPPSKDEAVVTATLQDSTLENQPGIQMLFVPVQRKYNGWPDHLKTGVENLSGFSMDDVKVHNNADKPAQLQAYVHAKGRDIHIAPGQEKHPPHEAWHVVQQQQGRVKATMQMKGVRDDTVLEKRQGQFSGSAPIQRVIKVQSDAAKIGADLAKYCEGKKSLKGATPGASGEVYLSKATAALGAELLESGDDGYVEEGGPVVVKKVIVQSMDRIRTEDVEGSDIPLEALLPGKLNNVDVPDAATNTFVTLQVMDRGVIKSYYLIMEYAEGGDQAHKVVKKSEIADFNDEAKAYYKKLEAIFTRLAASGYKSGDIKPANIFIDSQGLPMLGDFGDYTVGNYIKKAEDIMALMNDLMKRSGQTKTYDQIVAWAGSDSQWVVPEVVAIPEVLPVEDAVDKAIVGGDNAAAQ